MSRYEAHRIIQHTNAEGEVELEHNEDAPLHSYEDEYPAHEFYAVVEITDQGEEKTLTDCQSKADAQKIADALNAQQAAQQATKLTNR